MSTSIVEERKEWILPTDRFWRRQAWCAIRLARRKGFHVWMTVITSFEKMSEYLNEDDVVFYMWPLTSGTGAAIVIGSR